MSLYSNVEHQHGAHANYLFFMLTNEGYICFRGDPHGFGETEVHFIPRILDNYLEIYLKVTFGVIFYTNKELRNIYDFPIGIQGLVFYMFEVIPF